MRDYKILRFLDIFKNIFERLDIDYLAMRRILQIKLTLDSRRVSTVLENSTNRERDKDKNNFIRSLGIYLLFGLFMIPLVILGENYLFQMSMVFGIFMFFMATSLIADFSSVLLDIRDKEILLSRPINSRTLNASKILHIFFYVFMITMAIMGPSLIAVLIKRRFLFFIIFLIELVLIDLFLIVITGIMYILILKFFDGERLKDIINYVQIGLTIMISVGYQFIGRLFNLIDLKNIEFGYQWWGYFLPSIWFAASFEWILNSNRDKIIGIYSIMALIIPVLSIIIYIKLIPIFETNLQKLNDAGKPKKKNKRLENFISKLVCRDKEERVFYKFANNMIKNERTFKLKVYPSLGLGFIFPLIMLFSLNIGEDWRNVGNSKMYFSMYFIFFSIAAMVQFLKYSGDYKGAWIYNTMPIRNINSLYKGTLKAAFFNLFTPLFIIVSIIFLFIFKFKIIIDIIIIYFNMMLSILMIFKLGQKDIPFSVDFNITERAGFMEMILSIGIIAGLFGLHFIFERINYGISIYLIIIVLVNILAWKQIFKLKNIT